MYFYIYMYFRITKLLGTNFIMKIKKVIFTPNDYFVCNRSLIMFSILPQACAIILICINYNLLFFFIYYEIRQRTYIIQLPIWCTVQKYS